MSSAKSARKTVSVRIAGRDYKVVGDGDEEGLIRIAGYVDRAMDRIRARTGTVDSHEVAVLTCLNLAREILAIHELRSSGVDGGRLQGLIERVESAIARRPNRASAVEPLADSPATRAVSEPPAAQAAGESAIVRTLELPSVEELTGHRPNAAASGSEPRGEPAVLPRAAAGGDRNG